MALSDLLWEPDEGWRDDAACAGSGTEFFFAVAEEDPKIEIAKEVCAGCPVRDECLAYALSTNQTEGVWGGMTGTERRRLRRRLRDRQRRAS